MSRHQSQVRLQRSSQVALAPNVRQDVDRTFGVPVGVHTAFFGLLLVYLGIMGLGFQSPEMVIPIAICIFFTAAFYAVPMLWAVMNPPKDAQAMPMGQLLGNGVDTHTGRTKGRDAMAQVLVLPILILGWGIAVVSIAALV